MSTPAITMAAAQAMEEELQQSVVLSDEEQGYETADTAGAASIITAAVSNQHAHSSRAGASRDEDEEFSDRDASGEEDQDTITSTTAQIVVSQQQPVPEDDESEQADDVDAEGEEDDEGVGAVKFRPGDLRDEDDEDEKSDGSNAVSEEDNDESANEEEDEEEEDDEDEDDEEEAAWDEDAEAEEVDASENGANLNCIFCSQDEDHDPSEEFETYLACRSCGGNAHQQCAREVDAMDEENSAGFWRCPQCLIKEPPEEDAVDDNLDSANERPMSAQTMSSSGLQAPRELLPSQKAQLKANSYSVFNKLVLHEDPQDGSRLLRKRKTSSVDEHGAAAFRKRRRNHEVAISEDVPRPSRPVRLKVNRSSAARIEKRSSKRLLVAFQVKPASLRTALGMKRRYQRRVPGIVRTPRGSAVGDVSTPAPVPFIQTPFTTDSYTQPFYSFFDKDTDGANGKPYGGILTEAEADTSKTFPEAEDRKRFEQAKQKAEDEWRARVLAMQAEVETPFRKKHKANSHASQIECVQFGPWEIDTWYAAPYPAEYSRNRVLYICEFCLKYMNSGYVAWRHKLKCATKHPPGDEIYRHKSISVFEVDGRKNPVYCQNLCLLAKLFLGSKTLYYDVEPFLFYILCEYDEQGYHLVGYFSKEKRTSSQNNVSCILTLPIHQRKGYGNLLIDFSYLLTKAEEKTGSPEKPLSDMGLVSYRNYWRLKLCQYFLRVMQQEDPNKDGLSIRDISDDTGMTPDDVISALEGLRALVRDPQTKLYAFRVDLDYCKEYVAKWEAKRYVELKPEALAWTPYIMGRSNAVNFELGPPISTVAPREEEEARVVEGPNGISSSRDLVVNGEPIIEEDEKAVEQDEAVASQPAEGDIVEVGTHVMANGGLDNEEDDVDVDDAGAQAEVDQVGVSEAWTEKYRDIPTSRFEVFPPVTGGRRGGAMRRGVSRPSLPRAPSSASRPRRGGRRSAGGRGRGSARRKTGGTGRGPGRWPKGTKKSDYGNAASGPGLPPGWSDKQESGDSITLHLPEENVISATATADEAQDEVMVSVAASETAHMSGANGVDGEDEDMDAEGEDE